jgi:hypothetical protein
MGWYCGPRGLMRRRGLASKARCHVKGSCPWTPPYADFNTPLTMVRGDLLSSYSLRCDYSMAALCWFLVAPCVSLTWFSLEQSSDDLSAAHSASSLVFVFGCELPAISPATWYPLAGTRLAPCLGSEDARAEDLHGDLAVHPFRRQLHPASCSSPLTGSDTVPGSNDLASAKMDNWALVPWVPTPPLRHIPEPALEQGSTSSNSDLRRADYGRTTPRQVLAHRTPSPEPFLRCSTQGHPGYHFGLIFELRQGVDDLHFRVLAVDRNVASLLQLLTSLRGAAPSEPAEEHPASAAAEKETLSPGRLSKKPHSSQHAEHAQEMDTEQMGAQDTQPAVSTEGGVDVKRWDDQTTYIEEEPWFEVDHNTWQDYRASL